MSFNMKFSFEFIKIKYNMEYTLFPSNPGVYFGFEVLVAIGALAMLIVSLNPCFTGICSPTSVFKVD